MNPKKSKMNALNKLRYKKSILKAESEMVVQVLDNNFEYLQNNFSSLLTASGTNYIKSKLPPVISNLLFKDDKQSNNNAPAKNELFYNKELNKQGLKYPALNQLADQLLDLAPLFFKGFKPMMAIFFAKSVKDLLFKR